MHDSGKRFTWECTVCGASGNSTSGERMLLSHMIVSENCPAANPDRARLTILSETSISIDIKEPNAV